MVEITYAKAGETPVGWRHLIITDLDTGKPLPRVIEINTVEGWAIVYDADESGRVKIVGDEFATKRITGRFSIETP